MQSIITNKKKAYAMGKFVKANTEMNMSKPHMASSNS